MVLGLFGKKKMRIEELLLVEDQIDEGRLAKVILGGAIIASLWGINNNLAQKAYEASPQLQKLTSHLEYAREIGDKEAIKDLERRIVNHKARIDLGYGEVRGHDGLPIVPEYDREYRASQDKRRD